MVKLSKEQCDYAMAHGEFDCLGTGLTIIILTQSWCSQWHAMEQFLDEAVEKASACAFYIEYDKEPWFEEFMTWKEDVLNNRFVPYLRYYKDGKLICESNFVSRDVFISNCLK
jgi:hypothetical protein